MQKLLVWMGLFVGSTLGGMIPQLWGESSFGGWGIVLSVVGGLAGIVGGYRLGRVL